MGVIDDLSRKLKSAQRAMRQAEQKLASANTEARLCLKAFEERKAAVHELESAISLLRNGLKPVKVSSGNVTPLR